MSRYIDIEPILEWCDNPEVFEPYGVNSVELERKIRQAPSVDIIRCRECKWCDDAGKKRALICTNPYIDVDPHPNFFCGYGEREGE